MTKIRSFRTRLLPLLLLAALFAGCAGGSQPGGESTPDGDDPAEDSTGAEAPEQIVLLSYGGPWDELTQEHVADPFTEETGIEVAIVPGSDDLIGAVASQRDNPQYDLILTGWEDHVFLRDVGALDELNPDDIPNMEDLYPIARTDHGVGTSITGVTLLYNTEMVETPPTSWADLWDDEYAGHVSIPQLPQTYGIDFLVMAARINGGDESNIDPGFEAIEELKPNIAAVYDSSGQVAQLFQQGDVWVAPWFAGRVPSMNADGVPVAAAELEEGAVAYLTMLSPLKGQYSEHVGKFLNYYLSDETQRAFATEFASGPSRSGVELDDEVAETVPYGQQEVDQMIQLDWETILENRDDWTQRFNRIFS